MSRSDIPLLAVRKDPPVEDPGVLSAVVNCATPQPSTEPGLRFRLVVTNETDDTVELDNPYESVTYEVTNAEGWPIAVAPPVSRVRVDGPPREPGVKAAYLALEGTEVDGEPIAPESAAEAETFTLGPHASIGLDLVVPVVLTAYQATTSGPPAVGDYHVKLFLPLRWAVDGKSQSFMLRSTSAMDITVADD